MSIETRVDKVLNIIIRKVTGELSADEIKQAFSSSLSHPDFRKNMHVIWDLAEADLSQISEDQLIETVDFILNNTNTRGAEYRIAIVASKDLSFGMSRMFEGYGSTLPAAIRVFRSKDEARKWIEGEVLAR